METSSDTLADRLAPPQHPVVQHQKRENHNGHHPESALHGQRQKGVGLRSETKRHGERSAHASVDGAEGIGQGHHSRNEQADDKGAQWQLNQRGFVDGMVSISKTILSQMRHR